MFKSNGVRGNTVRTCLNSSNTYYMFYAGGSFWKPQEGGEEGSGLLSRIDHGGERRGSEQGGPALTYC